MSYRLKKKYSTLPSDWEEGMEVHIKGVNPYYSTVDSKYRLHYLYIYDVENNPEFWEEVVEKDYEILEILFYGNQTYPNIDGKFNGYHAHEVLSDTRTTIVSVKRLSDSVIFTVGDNTKEGKILDFDFPGSNKAKCRYKIDFDAGGNHWRMLSEAVKVVKVELGRTEDTGKPVYHGDKVFILTPSWTCPEITMSKNEYFKTPPRLFEDKKKAEEWILFNRKSFSINDIVTLCGIAFQKRLVEHLRGDDNDS